MALQPGDVGQVEPAVARAGRDDHRARTDLLVVADIEGVVHRDRPGLSPSLRWTAEATNHRGVTGTIADALVGADVFVGLSAPDVVTGDDVARMAPDAIVFALANPRPEVDPDEAARHAAVVGTGRSDFANQINNVLAFPGVFRGLLDAQSHRITDAMLLAAAEALASTVRPDELNPTYIVPSVFHPDVTSVVAAAVARAAHEEGAAREPAPATGEIAAVRPRLL